MISFVQSLGHYLYPRYSNDHKAKLLHPSSLIVVALMLLFYQLFLQGTSSIGVKILGYAANISPEEVVRLTNDKRRAAGLSELRQSTTLTEAAKAKGEHMLANDYWAHTAPDGTEPWKFFTDFSYKYRYAGENLARDFSNPQSAIDAWMASPSHKENMLSTKYTEIGIAVVEGDLAGVDTTLIVQFFGTKLSDSPSQATVAKAAENQNIAQAQFTPTPFITITVTPTVSPIVTVTPAEVVTPIKIVPAAGVDNPPSQTGQVLISPFGTTRTISLLTVVVLAFVFVVDALAVYKRKIPRIGGRTFAHLAFLGMILAIIIIAKSGQIL